MRIQLNSCECTGKNGDQAEAGLLRATTWLSTSTSRPLDDVGSSSSCQAPLIDKSSVLCVRCEAIRDGRLIEITGISKPRDGHVAIKNLAASSPLPSSSLSSLPPPLACSYISINDSLPLIFSSQPILLVVDFHLRCSPVCLQQTPIPGSCRWASDVDRIPPRGFSSFQQALASTHHSIITIEFILVINHHNA